MSRLSDLCRPLGDVRHRHLAHSQNFSPHSLPPSNFQTGSKACLKSARVLRRGNHPKSATPAMAFCKAAFHPLDEGLGQDEFHFDFFFSRVSRFIPTAVFRIKLKSPNTVHPVYLCAFYLRDQSDCGIQV